MLDNMETLKVKFSLSDNDVKEITDEIKKLQKMLKDTDKLYNNKYRKKLEQYHWVIPYGMEYLELNKILSESNTQDDFYNKLLNYFNDNIVNDIFDKIINLEINEHREMINQIRKSYFENYFSLINCSIISLIDYNLMFYLKDKRNLKRQKLADELINQTKTESGYFFSKYELNIVLNFIKFLFNKLDFNNIILSEEQLLNRHLSQHGFLSSNKKIDSLLLINVLYYLLEFQCIFKKYENSIIW